MRKSLLALAIAAAALPTFAKDYGVQGNVWKITEIDVRQLLISEVSKGQWDSAKSDLKDSANKYLENLPKRNLPEVDVTKVAWVDPSFVLEEDIKVPYKDFAGNYSWRILHKAGTRVNPLDKISPSTAMLFFDGSVPAQVALVKQVLAKEPNRVVPVEAGSGNLKEVNEQIGRGVFHADDPLVNRFEVRYLPTLVYPGSGAKRGFIEVTSYARPFDAAAVIKSWPSLTQNFKK